MMGKTEEQAREEFRPEAEKNVKSRLVIEAVVEAEKIKADADHVKEHLEELAKQYGQKVEDLEKNEDVKDYFEKAVQNEEAVKFLVENAKKVAAKKEAKSEDSEKKAKKTTKK
jgi:trigger factor